MINYIKYTMDGKTYSLIDNGDGTWSKEANAPQVSGNYALLFEISENGIITFIDSSDNRYDTFLQVIGSSERKIFLINYLPDFLHDVLEFNVLFDVEDFNFDQLYSDVEKVKNDMFISLASNDAIVRMENFLQIKGQGTLSQRKSYINSLFLKGKKLNETKIKEITNTITGSDCIIKFYGADELNSPELGYSIVMVQVLSPDNSMDCRYEDIARVLRPLVPSHVKLLVIRYFALWDEVKSNFNSWGSVKAMTNWQAVKDYIPPQ